MRQLSRLAHEYTTMGILGPIQLIGRRRSEYPLVQDTVSSPLNRSSSWGRSSILLNYSSSSVVGLENWFNESSHLRSSGSPKCIRRVYTLGIRGAPLSLRPLSMPCYFYATPR